MPKVKKVFMWNQWDEVEVYPGYTWLNYIQSSGSQWINTEYTPTVNTEIETDISWQSSQPDSWSVFFWVTGNDSSGDWIIARIYSWNATTYNPWFCNGTYSERQISITVDTFHNIVLKKNWWSVDWTAYSVSTSWTPYQSPIFIFCWNNGWNAWRYSICKIQTFKILENWTLVRDFLPAKRNSDGAIWLYDKVEKKFYTNKWSGNFIAG